MKFNVNHGVVKDGKNGKFLKLLLGNPAVVCKDGLRPESIEWLLNLSDAEMVKKAKARCEKIQKLKGSDTVMTIEFDDEDLELAEISWNRKVSIQVSSPSPAIFGEETRVRRVNGGASNL